MCMSRLDKIFIVHHILGILLWGYALWDHSDLQGVLGLAYLVAGEALEKIPYPCLPLPVAHMPS